MHASPAELTFYTAAFWQDKPPHSEPLAWLGILSALTAGASAVWAFFAQSSRKSRLHERQVLLDEMRRQILEDLERLGSHPRTDIEENVELLVSSSPANAPNLSSDSKGLDSSAVVQLQDQISSMRQQIEKHRNEIIEIQRIDPVLEATLKTGVENLAKRLEALERQALTKWDVALIFLQLLGGIGVVVSAVFAALKYLQK